MKFKFVRKISRQIVGKFLVVRITYSDGSAMIKRHYLR